jgi:DNA-binding Lrp family transcriptional regulator
MTDVDHLSDDDGNRLARRVQKGIPLVADPWSVLAEELGLGRAAILAQLNAWSDEGKLREISAVLEGSVLGWDSALVAGTVPEERIDEVAAVVSAHPTVTHNYMREHTFNLWFTISVPPHMSLERTLELLAEEAGVSAFRPLRRTRTFKIGVNFDLKKQTSLTENVAITEKPSVDFGPREQLFCRALQTPLPLVEAPFQALAETFGFSAEELLAFANEHMGGAVRRYVATYRHRKLGVRGNGMSVWNIPDEQQDELGLQLAAAPEVSHCYARNAVDGFPFTTYAMIHGPDRESVLGVAQRLSGEIGIDDYTVLFSTREFKKTRLRYFLPELEAWWTARTAELTV